MRKLEEEERPVKKHIMSEEKYKKRKEAINKLTQRINDKIQENHRLGRSGHE